MLVYKLILAFLLLTTSCKTSNFSRVTEALIESKEFSENIEKSRLIVNEYLKKNQLPGMSIAISKNSQLVWAEGFGFSDFEKKIKMTPENVFRVSSISKTLTSAGLGKLLDREKIDLDEDIRSYVPYFPPKKYKITTRLVASHMGGVRDYNDAESRAYNSKQYHDVKDQLNIFMNDPLIFKPGTEISYSTYGWVLISAAIEGAADQDFLNFMKESVFDPLNMKSTFPEDAGYKPKNLVNYYQCDPMAAKPCKLRRAPVVNNSNKWAGGGFMSSTLDLIKFGQAILDDKLLKRKTRDILFTPVTTQDVKENSYGLGWCHFGSNDKNSVYIGHDGRGVGNWGIFRIALNKGIVLAVLINSDNWEFQREDFAEELLALW